MHSNHTSHRIFLFLLLTLLIVANQTGAVARADKRKTRSVAQQAKSSLSRTELKKAAQRLSEMGYANGNDGGIDRSAIIAFQKWEGLDVTGRITRADYEAIMNANAPQPKDAGYKHVEVDLDRQVLLLIDDNGEVEKILPVSTGSEQRYNVKGMSGLAYTPRGRFRIYSKLSGWKRSPLGLLYYPNYFSDGLAIHGNPSVPDNPQSHGCIRIPMSSAAEMSDLLPVGTIVLIYDQRSFVSAKDWAQADREKQQAANR
jgi:lipoprotein-anchoring transpeptidase ErfK/SrfK